MEMEVDASPATVAATKVRSCSLSEPFDAKELFAAAEAENSDVFLSSIPKEDAEKAASLVNDDGRSLLHVASSAGKRQMVELLCSSESFKSIVNKKDEEGWAPIHSAANCGHLEVVKILLVKGADINLQNDGGRTALHYAASKGWVKMAELLISYGANINKKDKVGCTPLHRAASTGNAELCELLIEEGADIDAADKSGQTPLMLAVICGKEQVAVLLMRHGADVDIEDKEGYTVLGRASSDCRPVLIEAAKAMLEG